MIEISNLDFSFAGSPFRLKINELKIATGEFVAVIGPSGSGKTTLLNLISGIYPSQDGKVKVAGHSLGQMSDSQRRAFRLRHLGMVFQSFELIDYLDVLGNILLPCRIGDVLQLNDEVFEHAQRLACAVGLDGKLDRKPNQLSQGERQRTAICRALLAKPKLLLADEATGNLDPATKTEVLEVLFEQSRAAGASILAVTHDHELLPFFDRQIDFRDFVAAP